MRAVLIGGTYWPARSRNTPAFRGNACQRAGSCPYARSAWSRTSTVRCARSVQPACPLEDLVNGLVDRRGVGDHLEVPDALVIGAGGVDVDPLAQRRAPL